MRNMNELDSVSPSTGGKGQRERLLSLMVAAERRRQQAGGTISPRGQWPGPIPLSYAQERLWFLDQMGLAGAAYNVPLALRLSGELVEAALERSFTELVRRHESLRTRLGVQDGLPQQLIDEPGPSPLRRVDLSSVADAGRREQELRELLRREQSDEFDLYHGPLIRVTLVKLDQREHALLITLHHVVVDGWSLGILVQEISALYSAHVLDQPDSLPRLGVQYADYAVWQRRWLLGEAQQEQLNYWRERLLGAPPQLQLPTDRPRPAVESFKGATFGFELPAPLARSLKELGRFEGATLFMVALAAYQLLLSRWSGQTNIVVGAPIAGRRHQEIEALIGFFVNTLALRTEVSAHLTFRQFLARVKEITLGAYAHQDLPFEALVKELRPERSLTRQPIFQVTLSVQNYPEQRLQLPGVTWTRTPVEWTHAHFDLMLYLHESATGLSGMFEYATDLFDAETIQRMAAHFQRLLEGIVAAPDLPMHQLPLLGDAEKQQLLMAWNASEVPTSSQRCVTDLFQEQAERTPDAVAVMHEEQSVTYAELNRRAEQLARYLKGKGVGPDELVGICVERSVEMVMGLLGILKAGGAYVPLDPNYPADRLQYMLSDAAPRLVLTQARLSASLAGTQAELIGLDTQWKEIAEFAETGPSTAADPLTPRSLVYVIYTSGSTGRPKGTAMAHSSMVSLIEWHRRSMGTAVERRVLQFAPLSFDVAFQETFSTLCTGGTLVLLDEWIRKDASALTQFLIRRSIQTLFLPPLMLQSLAEHCQDAGVLPGTLKDVITAGEQLRISPEISSFFQRLNGCRLHNHYGPTETHVVTALTLTGEPGEWPALPAIGRPVANAKIYILDEHQHPVPIGVTGEIYIGGAGVARGYLRRPELTMQRFLADPFSSDPEARLYKTGDLGCWRQDGSVQYLGRNDAQVKIRGFRIELAEVEAAIVRHEHVGEAVVVAREGGAGQKRLVAYVTSRDSASVRTDELRAYLQGLLPEHMMPSAIVVLDAWPLTPSGKLDRRALPEPDLVAHAGRQYEAPEGPVEQALAGVWQELLRIEQVGRQDHFFELGGHSLLIVQLMERLRRMGLSADVRSIYGSPRLAHMAAKLTHAASEQFAAPENLIPSACEAITPAMLTLVTLGQQHIDRIVRAVPGGAANIQDIYPLAPLQEGILFHHLLSEQGGDSYARSLLMSLSSRQRLEELIRALQAVVDRHDVLRTAILWKELPQPVQVVQRHVTLPVEQLTPESGRDALDQLRERMAPEHQRLDLRRAPLLQLTVARTQGSAEWYALLQTHHIVTDQQSSQILMAEVMACVEGRETSLPEAAPYRYHVAHALASAQSRDAEAFFRGKLGDIDEPTAPFGLLNVRGNGSGVGESRRTIESATAQRIRTQAQRVGVSVATLFHAVWGLVVSLTSGRDDVVFGSVLLGRLQGSAGSRHTLGMFINTLPLRLRLQGVTARQLVAQVHQELVGLLSHEQTSLAQAQRCSGIAESTPLFSTLLNYVHAGASSDSEFASATGITYLGGQGGTNYPITLSVSDHGDSFVLDIKADRSVDPQRIVGYVETAAHSLLDALESAPRTLALSLSVLSESDRHEVLQAFNPAPTDYPQDKMLHELFEEQVERNPHALAVTSPVQSLTYSELNSSANRLAHHLRRRGVVPGDLVAICAERSVDMLVGLLGILKAGAAYVPLDPDQPPDRLTHILRDSAPKALLVQEARRQLFPMGQVETIALDIDNDLIRWERDSNLPGPGASPMDLAYVIYTSGSTGKPKGVMVHHRALVNLMYWHRATFGLREGSRCSSVAAVGFDATAWEIWSSLSIGVTLVLAPPTRDVDELLEWWAAQPLDISFLPTPLAELALSQGLHSPGLRCLLAGGDRLRVHPGARTFQLINNYGPTESTVVATSGRIDEADAVLHIGRPIANTQIYILDRHCRPVPVGVAGEIHIGGACIARGYLNQPALTAERFLADPFSADTQARMYRTGDLARWRDDGTIEYLGRNDHQVKIRGFRIELGEIEVQLATHSRVKDAVVLDRDDGSGEKRLVAYVIPDESDGDGFRLGAEELRAHIKGMLPNYMVPGAFVMLDRFPLTPNGKLDRRALPSPDFELAGEAYEPPEGAQEVALADIWRELLQVERVGRHSNFFELGGHSLHGMKLVARIAERLKVSLPVAAVFRYPTIQKMARIVESSQPMHEASVSGETLELDEGVI